MREYLKKSAASLALLGYLGCMIFGFFHLLMMAEMSMPMENCPFIQEHQFFCQANILQHIETLKGVVYFALPMVFIYLFSYFWLLPFVVANNSPPFLLRIRLYVLGKNSPRIYFLYQSLYSQGILNSKAY